MARLYVVRHEVSTASSLGRSRSLMRAGGNLLVCVLVFKWQIILDLKEFAWQVLYAKAASLVGLCMSSNSSGLYKFLRDPCHIWVYRIWGNLFDGCAVVDPTDYSSNQSDFYKLWALIDLGHFLNKIRLRLVETAVISATHGSDRTQWFGLADVGMLAGPSDFLKTSARINIHQYK